MALDTSKYFLIQNFFLPGMQLSTSGDRIVFAPKATTLSQLGTQMWAFRGTPDADWYRITNLAQGAGKAITLKDGETDPEYMVGMSLNAGRVWQVVPPSPATSSLVTIGTASSPSYPSSWLIFVLSAGYKAGILQGNGFSFFKYWQLTPTAVRV